MIGGLVPLIYSIMKRNRLLWFVKVRLSGDVIKKTVANGSSAFISNAALALIGIVFNMRLMALIGSDGVVAYGIVMYVNYIVSGVFMGYSTGIAPVVSYNLGSNNKSEIRELFKKSLVVLGSSAIGMVALVMIFAEMLAYIFVSYDAGLMELTTNAIRLYNWSFFLCGFNLFVTAFFAALNDGVVSSILSVTRTLVFQLALVFIMPVLIGSDGIWLSVTIAEILSIAVAFAFVLKSRDKYGCF